MSHTPGPWTLVFDVDGPPGFIWGKTTCVCDFGKDVPKPEDARLIAAAPELLKELREMLEYARILRSSYLDDEDLRGKGTMIEEDIERVEALLKRVEKGGA